MRERRWKVADELAALARAVGGGVAEPYDDPRRGFTRWRAGMKIGRRTLVARIDSKIGTWTATCDCGNLTPGIVYASVLARRVRAGLPGGCRACWKPPRVLDHVCGTCGTRDEAKRKTYPRLVPSERVPVARGCACGKPIPAGRVRHCSTRCRVRAADQARRERERAAGGERRRGRWRSANLSPVQPW